MMRSDKGDNKERKTRKGVCFGTKGVRVDTKNRKTVRDQEKRIRGGHFQKKRTPDRRRAPTWKGTRMEK